MASFVSVNPILEDGPAIRISQESAISKPPPKAGPSIAAMVGIGSVYFNCKFSFFFFFFY